jgi:hypothetical protein
MQFVTSHGSPTTSDGSGSDLENQNREERKEEERSVEEIAREVARGGHRPTVGGARASTATSTTMSGGRGGGSGWSTPPNSSFKDIEDTGKWGNVTKKEKIIVFTCFIMILVAIAVGVGVFVAGRYKGGTSSSSPSSGQGDGDANATSPLPPPPETFATIEDKYSALLRLLGENPLTANYSTAVLSAYLRDLDSLGPSVVDDPIVRATKWAMETDADNLAVDQLRYRLALASVYYANNGDGWNNHQGWLSPDHVCEWGSSGGGGSRSVNEQVKCTLDMETGHRIVNELDLSSNNLTGSIPVTVSLLTTLKGMWLRDNALTGAIPGAVFGSLPKLVILYLQHNKFEGEIPVSLLDSGSLGTCEKGRVCVCSGSV